MTRSKKEIVKSAPRCIQHTIDDDGLVACYEDELDALAWSALLECDIYEEDDDDAVSHKDFLACRTFIARCRAAGWRDSR